MQQGSTMLKVSAKQNSFIKDFVRCRKKQCYGQLNLSQWAGRKGSRASSRFSASAQIQQQAEFLAGISKGAAQKDGKITDSGVRHLHIQQDHRDIAVAFEKWLQKEYDAGEQNVELYTDPATNLEFTVAKRDLTVGEEAFHIPFKATVNLENILGDGSLAELLTTNKLSELAVITLYLMYEKKRKKESQWEPFIKVLDKQRGRSSQGIPPPLIWDEKELNDLLKGSPTLQEIKQRKIGIQKEYDELDTVWFMAKKLFEQYPYQIPSEEFSFERFKQAFTAIQSTIIHLQGVTIAKRFALVPFGPPILTYNSTSKAMVEYSQEKDAIILKIDQNYKKGDKIQAWCGPQSNTRLFINYGIVNENNPYDKLSIKFTISQNDLLFTQKKLKLQEYKYGSQQSFSLQRNQSLHKHFIPYIRIAFATSREDLEKIKFNEGNDKQVIVSDSEKQGILKVQHYLQDRLNSYGRSLEDDTKMIDDPNSGPKQKSAARLTRIEKEILKSCLSEVQSFIDKTQIDSTEYYIDLVKIE